MFSEVDNPGGWDLFTYRAKFTKDKKYDQHCLLTLAEPVGKNEDGVRAINGWTFDYTGHTGSSNYRNGSTNENLFPPERKGCLNVDLLKKLGMTK